MVDAPHFRALRFFVILMKATNVAGENAASHTLFDRMIGICARAYPEDLVCLH